MYSLTKKILLVSPLILFFLISLKVISKPLPSGLPDDIKNYRQWTRLNKKLINPTNADPHRGLKRVYVNRQESELIDSNGSLIFPYPLETIVVKEVRKTNKKKSKIVLIAIMRKQQGNEDTGDWDFIEYTRLRDNSFEPINFPKESCYSCHQGASLSDAVWTKFDNFKSGNK